MIWAIMLIISTEQAVFLQSSQPLSMLAETWQGDQADQVDQVEGEQDD